MQVTTTILNNALKLEIQKNQDNYKEVLNSVNLLFSHLDKEVVNCLFEGEEHIEKLEFDTSNPNIKIEWYDNNSVCIFNPKYDWHMNSIMSSVNEDIIKNFSLYKINVDETNRKVERQLIEVLEKKIKEFNH